MKKDIFKPTNKINIPYYFDSTVFKPNLTSELIVKGIEKNKNLFNKKNILDMGCGTGVIGISVKKKILTKSNIFFSDISDSAIKLTRKNCILNNIDFEVNKSSLLNGWNNKKFDLIINDVSAISSFFSKKKIWYNKYIPSDTGEDGTKQVTRFLNQSRKLNINNIIMPLISLCNINKIKKIFSEESFKIFSLISQDWPLPDKFVLKEKKNLLNLKKKKHINFRELYGYFIANTEVLYLEKKSKL